ncbi:hypothetical protein [Actinoallomurus rhizosphaericola]|uniref:hypothetical protein n=1 Tax=Actinoallomurus rhizosphaericola TaxID=2952536 RepID=UPI002092F07A|nr:hypothetical protein [Actinoallomurus rhizosphaericola]MCO5996291.1 hypothetical protein [Actinoallomurus rhizosphaericola]
MPYAALDAALIHIIGAVNVVVFRISRRRVVPYSFRGIPHARLTEIGQVPELDSPLVGYLRDGDDLILLVPERAPEPRWLGDMRNATNVTLEIQEGTSRSAIAIAGEGEADAEEAQRLREQVRDSATTRELNAHVGPIREADQTEVVARLLKGAALNERYEIRKQRLIPFVRLKAR